MHESTCTEPMDNSWSLVSVLHCTVGSGMDRGASGDYNRETILKYM